MKTHDIVCEADGWIHQVNGVRLASYPTWFMAITAARNAADEDARNGVAATLQFQGLDGEMRPVVTRMGKAKKAVVRIVADTLAQPVGSHLPGRLHA